MARENRTTGDVTVFYQIYHHLPSSIMIYHDLSIYLSICLSIYLSIYPLSSFHAQKMSVFPHPCQVFSFELPFPIRWRRVASRLLTPSFLSLASTSFCAARIPSTWQLDAAGGIWGTWEAMESWEDRTENFGEDLGYRGISRVDP